MEGPHDLNCNHNHVYEHTDRKDMQIFCLVIFWRQDDVAMIYITKKNIHVMKFLRDLNIVC